MTVAPGQSTEADPRRTPLGAELVRLARRLTGSPELSEEVVTAVLGQAPPHRLAAIAEVARACRGRGVEPVLSGQGSPTVSGEEARTVPGEGSPTVSGEAPPSLSGRVAAELAAANAGLPDRQREALALRDLTRLSYAQIGRLIGLEPPAVASLLARGRLALRARLRGSAATVPAVCVERENMLRLLARRLDSEPLREAEEDWLWAHLESCPGCQQAQLMMVEAAAMYRLWGRA